MGADVIGMIGESQSPSTSSPMSMRPRRKKFEFNKRRGAPAEAPDDKGKLDALGYSFWQRRVRTAAKHLRQDVHQADDQRRPASTSLSASVP